MASAVEFLREHVPESTRIHYIITNGGAAPNIVPDYSELFLYDRHPSMPALDGIRDRILKCAQAGTLATETRLEMEMIDSSYNVLPNDTLSALTDKNMRLVGGVTYTKDGSASTDAGDVGWMLPMAELGAATFVGVPAHSWQSTACASMSIVRKGMLVAAKTPVLTAMDLFTDPAQVEAAKASFEQRRAGFEYKSRVSADHQPPLNYRDNKYGTSYEPTPVSLASSWAACPAASPDSDRTSSGKH